MLALSIYSNNKTESNYRDVTYILLATNNLKVNWLYPISLHSKFYVVRFYKWIYY